MTPLNKVMLVDDEDDIREVAELALSVVGGLEVVCCNNGEQCLQRIDEASPDLIILDWMMPEMDGPTVLKTLRDNNIQIPVVFMTAKVQREEVESLLALGALGVIGKPFDPMTLTEEIKALWLNN